MSTLIPELSALMLCIYKSGVSYVTIRLGFELAHAIGQDLVLIPDTHFVNAQLSKSTQKTRSASSLWKEN
jgi:hypothetical protein